MSHKMLSLSFYQNCRPISSPSVGPEVPSVGTPLTGEGKVRRKIAGTFWRRR